MLMLVLQMTGLVGEIGSIVYSDFSSFGCVSGTTFLAEYPLFVLSLWLSTAWIFKSKPTSSDVTSTIHADHRHIVRRAGDSDYAFLSDDHGTDRY